MEPSMSNGQVFRATSSLHRIDARVKLVVCALFMISCLAVRDLPTLALAAGALGITVVTARVPARALVRQLRGLALFLALTALINLLFITTGPIIVAWGPVAIHRDGADGAFLYASRFFVLFVAGSLLMRTTTPLAIADALRYLLRPLAHLGANPDQIAMTISIALSFVPILTREARAVLAAQTARGGQWEALEPLAYARALAPLTVPLFVGALNHAEQLGRAMEARAYTGGTRTHLREPRLIAQRDAPFCLAFALYLVLMVILSARC